MIRTLYLRMVLLFLMVVTISITIGYMVSTQIYEKLKSQQVESELIKEGEVIIQLYQQQKPKDLDAFMNHISQLHYNLYLYDSPQNRKIYGDAAVKQPLYINPTDVNRVLKGEVIRLNLYNPRERSVGLPFQIGDKRYALFLQHNFEAQAKDFKQGLFTNLFIVIAVGIILNLIVSRYLVKPIQVMTEATKQFARGNFNVRIQVQRNDELGLLAKSFNEMAEELSKLEQMRQDFISNVSHEIQSPLTSIRGFSKALKDGIVTEEERVEYLEIIQAESERLSRLCENLLKLASLESDQHPFHPRVFRLDEQIRRVVVATEPQWSSKGLQFDLFLPKTYIWADEDLLNQVWMNLIHNSIKFTPPHGQIRIQISSNNKNIKVQITDTGIGMSEEDQKRIFQRFYIADRSRRRNQNGSGIGLSIVKKIVVMHKGEIEVKSTPGKGTTFVVTFPGLKADDDENIS
jgi:signal transduction histidine kinase